MRKIVAVAALVAVFVVGFVPQAQANPGKKHAELASKIPTALTDEGEILKALDAALGTDSAAIKEFQAECGIPDVSGDKTGVFTQACLNDIAAAIANARAAFAVSQKAVEDELAYTEDALAASRSALKLKLGVGPLEKPTFTPSAEVMEYALTQCAPGTQVRWLTSKKFTCTDPVFQVKTPKAEDCIEVPGGGRQCTLNIAALGAKYGREGVVPIPEPISFPEPEKPKGWCGGSTFCRAAVITTTVVVVGMGIAYGVHVAKDGNWAPFTVLR